MLLIDKPKGISSFDCIRRLRKQHPNTKFGHAGTLDPLASGLMIILENDETKHAADYVGLPKVYEVEALIGERRTTGDMEGDVLATKDVTADMLSEKAIVEVLEGLQGELLLPVPIYSAVKIDGEALYKKARRGECVVPPIKPMEIKEVVFTGLEYITTPAPRALVRFTAHVGSGVYIRSLVEEFGNRLHFPATTYNLRRTNIGSFSVSSASKI